MPQDQAKRVEPIYEEMPGWQETTAGARSWADLPAQAIKYIRRVEELIECPVALVSTMPSELKDISKGAAALLLLISALGIGCVAVAVHYWRSLVLYESGHRETYKEEQPLNLSSGTLSRFGKRCSLHMSDGKSVRLQCPFLRPEYRSPDFCQCFSQDAWNSKSTKISVLHGPNHKAAISYVMVYEAKAGNTVLVDRQKMRAEAEQFYNRPPDGRFVMILWIWMLLYFVAPLIPPSPKHK
jgi:hypothetical protein